MTSWKSDCSGGVERSIGSGIALAEIRAYHGETVHQAIDFFSGVVQVAGRARRRGHTQTPHQDLRAVMPGTHSDALGVEHGRNVVRVDAAQLKREHRRARFRILWSEHPQTFHGAEPL